MRSANFLEILAAKWPNLVGFCTGNTLFQSSQCDFNRVNVDFLTFYKVTYQNSESFFQKPRWCKIVKCVIFMKYLVWLWHAPCTREGGASVKSNNIAQFCSEPGSEKLWTLSNAIDRGFSHYWTCKIITSDTRWGNAPSPERQSHQTICSEKIATKKEKEKVRQQCAGLIP